MSLPGKLLFFKPVVPKLAGFCHPVRNLVELVQARFSDLLTALLAHKDQAAFAKNLNVFGNGLFADAEILPYLSDIQRPVGQLVDDHPAAHGKRNNFFCLFLKTR